jgi:acetyltransferase-like isoleucine patch superfamily enzyme
MKAMREVGFNKLFKYIFFTFWEIFFNVLIFSPFRIFWMRAFGARIGTNVIVGKLIFMNLYRHGLKGLAIGNNCFVGDNVTLDLATEIELGNNSTLSDGVFVLTHTNVGYKDHPLQKNFPSFAEKVIVGQGCFIGIRATIMPGVVIGEKSAIGSCALVLKNVPPGELHFGIPAVFKKQLA